MFVDGALGLTSAANRFIFQLLGGFPGWQTSGVGLLPLMTASCTICCTASVLAVQKFTRTNAFFKEFLAQLQ